MRSKVGVLSALISALASLAVAAPSPVADDPEAEVSSTVVAEVVVRPGGPVWWKVTRGSKTVYLLGVLWYYPKGMEWSEASLVRRLSHADLVALPPELLNAPPPPPPTGGPGDQIPEPLKARIAVAARRMRLEPERYGNMDALTLGRALVIDYRARLGLEREALVDAVQAAAKAQHKSVVSTGAMRAPKDRAFSESTTPQARIACLESALAEVEAGQAIVKDALVGWGDGDLKAALLMPRGLEQCEFTIPGRSDLQREAVSTQVRFVKSILAPARRGAGTAVIGAGPVLEDIHEAVMIVGLRTLLADGGVLETLRKQGYTVTSGG